MAIVRAIAGLGKGLRPTATTAEDVETTKQLDLLKEVGYKEVEVSGIPLQPSQTGLRSGIYAGAVRLAGNQREPVRKASA